MRTIPKPESKTYLTIKQVAAMIQTSPFFIYRQCELGKFPVIKMGKILRFDPAAVERWIQEQRRDPKAWREE